jgi:paraquat-inducible protein B
MIERGLRAQLRLQSLLTALLYVDVDFHPDKPATLVNVKTRYKQIPTIPTDLEQLTRNLESIDISKLGENLQEIVNGVNQLINDGAIQKLGTDVSATLASVRNAADQLNKQSEQIGAQLSPLAKKGNRTLDELNRSLPQLVKTLDTTLVTLQQTAQTLQQTTNNTTFLTSDDSPLLYRLEHTAASVNSAAEQMRRLTEMLERQPESLIYGKSEEN